MPLIYWFSRRMTLWGSISFNLAVFINIIIAFFYPYVEGASTGQDRGPVGRDLGAHGPLSQVWTEPSGQPGSEGTRCGVGRSSHCIALWVPHPIMGRHRCGPVGQTGSLTSRDSAHMCTHTDQRPDMGQQLEMVFCLRPRDAGVMGSLTLGDQELNREGFQGGVVFWGLLSGGFERAMLSPAPRPQEHWTPRSSRCSSGSSFASPSRPCSPSATASAPSSWHSSCAPSTTWALGPHSISWVPLM